MESGGRRVDWEQSSYPFRYPDSPQRADKPLDIFVGLRSVAVLIVFLGARGSRRKGHLDADGTLQTIRTGQARAARPARRAWSARPAGASQRRSRAAGPDDGLRGPLSVPANRASERAVWLDRTAHSGAGIVRLAISGGDSAPNRPPDPTNPGSASYNFSSIDGPVRDAEARGLEVLLTVNVAPTWAEGPGRPADGRARAPGSRIPPISPTSCRRSPPATRAASTRRPAPPLPAVQAIEVWNEANSSDWLNPQFEGTTALSPDYYREMLNASYGPIKAVNPQMLVVAGGTDPYGDPPAAHIRRAYGPTQRVYPVQFWQQLLCVHPVTVTVKGKKKKGKKGKKRRRVTHVSVREDAGLSRPGAVRRLRPPSDRQHRRRAAQVRPQPERRLHPGSRPARERAARRRAGRHHPAGRPPGLGDGVLVGQQPAESRGRPSRCTGALDRAVALPVLEGRGETRRSTSRSATSTARPDVHAGLQAGVYFLDGQAQALPDRLPLPVRHRADRQANAARLGQGSGGGHAAAFSDSRGQTG